MTIKQVESLSGMTRANIRFYENEGLLCPRRRVNGYRDYTENDVNTLRKIGLLRLLGISVGDIRALQDGTAQLRDVVTRRIAKIQKERSDLEDALDICRAIRADGPTYAELDPDDYFIRSLRAKLQKPEIYNLKADIPAVSLPCPWRRWLARILDMALYEILWAAVLGFLFRTPPLSRSAMGALLDIGAVLLITLLAEPLFLTLTGTTPGKAILGLRYAVQGRKPSYLDALCRTGLVLCYGLGFNIPIYALVCQYRSYKTVKSGGVLPWEEEGSYTLQKPRPWRAAAYAGCCALAVLLLFGVDRLSELPPHRGDLTVAQFADNMNDRMRYWGIDFSRRLNEQGAWEDLVIGTADAPGSYAPGKIYAESFFPPFTYDVRGGVLTGLQLSVHSSEFLVTQAHLLTGSAAAVSFIGARPEYGVFSGEIADVIDALAQSPFDSLSLTCAGVHLTYTVDAQGYVAAGEALFADPETDTHRFDATFSLEIAP